MGFSVGAELIWGIPVKAVDDDGEPTPFWDEEHDDWREFEDLALATYGHYDDEPRAILTSPRIGKIRGDAWDPKPVDVVDDLLVTDKVPSKANDAARAAGLDVNFYGPEAGWYLVASYG